MPSKTPDSHPRDSDEPIAKRPRFRIGESSVTLIAAVLGLISAVVTVAIPLLFRDREPNTGIPSPYYLADGKDFRYESPDPEFKLARQAAALESAAMPDFTLGVWTLHDSVDDEGTVWNNSTLKFTSQSKTERGAKLEGYFEWRSFDVTVGREYVQAHYDAAAQQIFIEGQRSEPADRLGVGSFAAEVSEDGRRLISGTWGSTPGNLASVPGKWNARR